MSFKFRPLARLNGDCASMTQSGKWQDDDCVKQKLAFTCQHARIFENCQLTDKKEACGFSGISEPECVEDFKCCFDPMSDIPCFKVEGHSYEKSKNSGITNAGASALTAFFFLAPPILFLLWQKYFSKSNPLSLSINNPTFS